MNAPVKISAVEQVPKPEQMGTAFHLNDLAIHARKLRTYVPKFKLLPFAVVPLVIIFAFILAPSPYLVLPTYLLMSTIIICGPLLVALYLLFRPKKILCHTCRKFLNMQKAWICVCCDTKNQNVQLHSFLDDCGICHEKPSGIWCPHCKAANVFEEDADLDRIAHFADTSRPEIRPKPPEVKDWRREQMEEIEFKLKLTKMNTALTLAEKEFKDAKLLAKSKPESASNKLEKRFDESFNRSVELHKIVEKKNKEAEELYASNPPMLALAKEAIQARFMEELQREDA